MNRKISVPLTSISITKENGALNGAFTHEKELQIERSQTVYFDVEFPINGELFLPANSLNLLIYDQNQTDISHKFEHCIVYHSPTTPSFSFGGNAFRESFDSQKSLWSYFIKSDVEINYGEDEKVLRGVLCDIINNNLILFVDGAIIQLDILKINSLVPLDEEKLQLYLNKTRRTDNLGGFFVYLNEKEDKYNYQSNNHSSTIKIVLSYTRVLFQSRIYTCIKLKENSVLEVAQFLSFHVIQQVISKVKIIYEDSESFIPFACENQTVIIPLSTFSIKYFFRTTIGKGISSKLHINNTSSRSLDSIVLMKDNSTSAIRLQGGSIEANEEISIRVQFENSLISEHDKEANENKYYFVNVTEFPIQIVDILWATPKESLLLPKEKHCYKTSPDTPIFGGGNVPHDANRNSFRFAPPVPTWGLALGEENINPLLKKVTFEEIRWDHLSGNSNFAFGTSSEPPQDPCQPHPHPHPPPSCFGVSSIDTAGECTAGNFGFQSQRESFGGNLAFPTSFIERNSFENFTNTCNTLPSPPSSFDSCADPTPTPPPSTAQPTTSSTNPFGNSNPYHSSSLFGSTSTAQPTTSSPNIFGNQNPFHSSSLSRPSPVPTSSPTSSPSTSSVGPSSMAPSGFAFGIAPPATSMTSSTPSAGFGPPSSSPTPGTFSFGSQATSIPPSSSSSSFNSSFPSSTLATTSTSSSPSSMAPSGFAFGIAPPATSMTSPTQSTPGTFSFGSQATSTPPSSSSSSTTPSTGFGLPSSSSPFSLGSQVTSIPPSSSSSSFPSSTPATTSSSPSSMAPSRFAFGIAPPATSMTSSTPSVGFGVAPPSKEVPGFFTSFSTSSSTPPPSSTPTPTSPTPGIGKHGNRSDEE